MIIMTVDCSVNFSKFLALTQSDSSRKLLVPKYRSILPLNVRWIPRSRMHDIAVANAKSMAAPIKASPLSIAFLPHVVCDDLTKSTRKISIKSIAFSDILTETKNRNKKQSSDASVLEYSIRHFTEREKIRAGAESNSCH